MEPEALDAIRLSLAVAAWATALSTAPALSVAAWLTRPHAPGRSIVQVLAMSPLIVPPTVVGYALLWAFGPHGPFRAFPLAFSFGGAVLASAVVAFPLYVRAAQLGLAQVDRGLLDAARCLGASPFQAWRTVALPLAMPAIASGAVLAFARSLGEFGATMVFAGNIPGVTRTLPLALYSALQRPDAAHVATQLAWTSWLLSAAAVWVAERVLQRRSLAE